MILEMARRGPFICFHPISRNIADGAQSTRLVDVDVTRDAWIYEDRFQSYLLIVQN